jgi:hypothetical protein
LGLANGNAAFDKSAMLERFIEAGYSTMVRLGVMA